MLSTLGHTLKLSCLLIQFLFLWYIEKWKRSVDTNTWSWWLPLPFISSGLISLSRAFWCTFTLQPAVSTASFGLTWCTNSLERQATLWLAVAETWWFESWPNCLGLHVGHGHPRNLESFWVIAGKCWWKVFRKETLIRVYWTHGFQGLLGTTKPRLIPSAMMTSWRYCKGSQDSNSV